MKARAPQKGAPVQNSRPDGRNDYRRVHRRRAHLYKIPAPRPKRLETKARAPQKGASVQNSSPTPETTRNEGACTAEGRISTKFPPDGRNDQKRRRVHRRRAHQYKIPARRPKRPETKARAPQKGASVQNSRPDGRNDQKRKRVHRRRSHHGNIFLIF